MKNSSCLLAIALSVLLACLAGCEGGGREASGSSASAAPAVSSTPVVVTWQPPNKPAEFLSAWRPPKE